MSALASRASQQLRMRITSLSNRYVIRTPFEAVLTCLKPNSGQVVPIVFSDYSNCSQVCQVLTQQSFCIYDSRHQRIIVEQCRHASGDHFIPIPAPKALLNTIPSLMVDSDSIARLHLTSESSVFLPVL